MPGPGLKSRIGPRRIDVLPIDEPFNGVLYIALLQLGISKSVPSGSKRLVCILH